MVDYDEITKYYIDYIIDIFNKLNIDERIKVLEYLLFRARYYNIRSLVTYENNLYHNVYSNYYNKKYIEYLQN